MLFREEGESAIGIPQPSHAWLSGQILRAWGNERFAHPAPFEEVCLGAALHDIGWLDWETAPTLDPATGRPHEFRAVSADRHARFWTHGVERALAFGRYPALLVSLHANTIYSTFVDPERLPEPQRAAVRAFLAGQREFQEECLAALAEDPRYGGGLASAAAAERNRLLVAAADRMSLAICWGVREEVSVPSVPVAGEERAELRLRPAGSGPDELLLAPWPFAAAEVELVAEACRIAGRYADEAAMQAALAVPAARVMLTTRLRPG